MERQPGNFEPLFDPDTLSSVPSPGSNARMPLPPTDLTPDQLLAESTALTEAGLRWLGFAANPSLGIGSTEALVIAIRLLTRAQMCLAFALPY